MCRNAQACRQIFAYACYLRARLCMCVCVCVTENTNVGKELTKWLRTCGPIGCTPVYKFVERKTTFIIPYDESPDSGTEHCRLCCVWNSLH